jgi:hypothetical protein
MEQMFKKFLTVAALCSVAAVHAESVISSFRIRPQSFNGARKVSNEVDKVHLYDMDQYYGNFAITPAYERTFRSGRIAGSLFGPALTSCDSDCATLLVQGSTVANRSEKALLADYFYLPTSFNSTLTFKPRISSFILDFNFYLGLDEWMQGTYVRVYAPFIHTKWQLNASESITTSTGGAYPAGYFDSSSITTSNLLTSAAAFFGGGAPAKTTSTTPITFNGLCYAKFNPSAGCDSDCSSTCDENTKNAFTEIRAELGWNFWQSEDYHLGFNLQAAAPTGNAPHAVFLFEPIAGNGKHWELGGGATGHYTFWRGCDADRHFSINMDLSVLHMFNAKQTRTFDLKGKPLSRYALAMKMIKAPTTAPVLVGATNAGTAASYVFNNEYSPVANLTTQDVKVSIGAQLDFTAWFNFTAGGFSADLGYNLWYSSCEKINCSDSCKNTCCPVSFAENTWALKGNSMVYGFSQGSQAAIPLSGTDNGADIFGGNSTFANIGTAGTTANDGVDNKQRAFVQGGSEIQSTNVAATTAFVNTSIQPIFITQSDIDNSRCDAGQKGLSNKVWGHLAYTWDRDGWVPFLGLGASAEFGKSDRNCNDDCNTDCSTSCSDCINTAVSQWGVWVKTGFSFN